LIEGRNNSGSYKWEEEKKEKWQKGAQNENEKK
jgi:hypothetical protein